MPMEVDYVGKEDGKKGGKKAKGKTNNKGKDKGKGKYEGKGELKGQSQETHGTDVSALPVSYGSLGEWRPGSKGLKMVDAHGKKIEHEGLTRAKVTSEGRQRQGD